MRKSLIYVALFVVVATTLGMAGCGQNRPTEPAKPATAPVKGAPAKVEPDRTGWPVIVAFGDSLTEGYQVDPKLNYPARLQGALDQKGYKYRVVNAGISGDTTTGGLNRVQAVIDQKPAIVILELGANDGMRGMPLDKMKANLQGIIDRLKAAKVQVVLAGIQIPPNLGPEYTQSFQQTYKELAEANQLPLIPFLLEGVAARPELNLPDGIHPTGEGYVYVVNNVLPVLEPLLQR
ncbi:MAG TPA: arylesterase [Symbiobacteriaceae bacterium]|nr:arylesterase [Symbiobacteriaceae bacterium]